MSASKGRTAPISNSAEFDGIKTTPKAAPAIPTLDLSPAIEHELHQLENLLRLVAFATEARRVLDGIELAKDNFPEVQQRIKQCVDYSSQWTCYEDTTASVLVAAADKVAEILDKV